MFVSVVSLLYRNREFRCFDWTKTNRRPTETVWRKHILQFFAENLGFFLFFFLRFFVFFFVFFGLFRLFRFYTETESFDVSIEPKQTEDPPKQIKREYIWVFFRKFRVVSVCYGLLRNRSVCFGCFDIGSKHGNTPKYLVFGFTKQTETNAKQILFPLVSVRTEIKFCLFRGHPTSNRRNIFNIRDAWISRATCKSIDARHCTDSSNKWEPAWAGTLATGGTWTTVENAVIRETKEGWPLLTVETEANGDSKSANEKCLSLAGSLGSSCRYKRFLSCLGCLTVKNAAALL